MPTKSENISKTTSLKVKEPVFGLLHQPIYSLPTLANKLPYMDCESEFDDFIFKLPDDNWRLSEFLPHEELPEISIELQAVTSIWNNYREETNTPGYAFRKIHVRSKIDTPRLNIDLDELLLLLDTKNVGALTMTGQEDGEFIEDGFAIRTPAGVFYGITYGKKIQVLGVHAYTLQELLDIKHTKFPDELSAWLDLRKHTQKICKHFNLIFVDWYRCQTVPEILVIY